MGDIHFDTLVVITPQDVTRLLKLYPRLVDNISYGKICFVGAKEVGEIVCSDENIGGSVSFVEENSLILLSAVHECIRRKMEGILAGRELPRGITGWYYQQFLKMQYAQVCKDEYYMVWDGDTIPCKKINMFQEESGKPYLDMKHEYHAEYFETLGKIMPGFRKVIERSFISEHMLIKVEIMKNLIAEIESNESIDGTAFWEKIINAIPAEKIQDSSFSEFETYGTYTAIRFQDVYKLREWHSFRQGGTFFSIDTISDRDFNWLSKDFDAISFEKGHTVREDNANLFDNPYYQEKLTPKQMLQAAQMEYKDGYKEVWADDENIASANVSAGGFPGKDNGAGKGKKDNKENYENKTRQLLLGIKGMLDENAAFLDELPVSDIISCVYVELYGLRQLYSKEHFAELDAKLMRYSDLLSASKDTGDVQQAAEIFDYLIDFQNALPDAELAQTFIENANYARALLRHRQEGTVLVIGDSHVNFFSGNEELSFIPIGEDVNTCEQVNGLPITVLHLGPALAYNSSRYGTSTRFREKLDWLMEDFIQQGDRIICVLGEIDMRAHVFKQTEIKNKPYQEIVDAIVENYSEFLLWLKNLGYEVCCYGPIASQKDSAPNTPEHPRVGSERDRNRATEYFTNRMVVFCQDNGIDFFSLFDEMITEDYETKEEFLSNDRFHLGQYAAKSLEKMLTQLGLI
jgi:hypothetical protein